MECIGFNVACGTLAKGVGVVLMGGILFIGSVYLVLSAVIGRWMGYLVLMVAFSGWLMIHASLWTFGFYSQGPDTPVNLGPRGSEPAWVPLLASLDNTSGAYSTFNDYPERPWKQPEQGELPASVQAVSGVVTTFLAERANEELKLPDTDPRALTGSDFTVDNVSFATAEDGSTPLSVVRAHVNDGGPEWTVSLYHDKGSVPRYSLMFLGGSVILFLIHLPLLDRAERKRKDILTGGTAPAWYGPA